MDGRVGSRKALQGAGGLGSTQGQGSSVSRRAGGLSGLLRQGRGIQGEAGRPPPHPPSCREGFCVPLLGGDTQACPVSIYRFFKIWSYCIPQGTPRWWTSG